MLQHPFEGIAHDSVLYTFQALARLHPDTLGHDIFLRFGSQDQYTLFSPLYAAAIRLFGLEPAAAILTLLAHLLFFCSAWLLARRFMGTELALVAVGLLIVLPSGYGAYYVFTYTEEYLTPRQPAEAFVLAGLAAALAGRYGWGLVSSAVAMSLHPIMGCAGAVMLVSLRAVIPKPKLAMTAACLAFITVTCVAYLTPAGPLARMDDTWLQIIHRRSVFLFIRDWSADDWARTLLPLGVLAVAAIGPSARSVRVFSTAALITAVAGIALSLVGGDLLRIVVILQAQTWRWSWLAEVIAVLLLPLICRDCWKANALARVSALLLVAGWICRGDSLMLCGLLMGAALLSALAGRADVQFARQSWIVTGAGVGVAILLTASLAYKMQLLNLSPLALEEPQHVGLQIMRLASTDGIVPAAIILAVGFAGRRWNTNGMNAALLIAAVIACASLFPSTWVAWTRTRYSQELYREYTPLRAKIPPDAEVLRPDALPYDLDVWYLLDRQRYLSVAQTAGLVFSRAAAVAMYQRAQFAGPLLADAALEDWVPKPTASLSAADKLARACADPALGYVLSWQNLGAATLASYMPDAHHPHVLARLYRCSDLRTAQ